MTANKKFKPGKQLIKGGILAVRVQALITPAQEQEIKSALEEYSSKLEPVLIARIEKILRTEMRKA